MRVRGEKRDYKDALFRVEKRRGMTMLGPTRAGHLDGNSALISRPSKNALNENHSRDLKRLLKI